MGEALREGMANTPSPPLKVAQHVEGSSSPQLVPGKEGSGVTTWYLESESNQTEVVRMKSPSSRRSLPPLPGQAMWLRG